MVCGIKDTATITGYSQHFLRKEARAGRIPHIKSGCKYLFNIETLEEFLKNKALEVDQKPKEYGVLRRAK